MKTENNTNPNASLWKWLADWWLAKSNQRARVAELDNLDPALAAGISHELGTSVGELRALAGKWPDSSPELLARRLQALDLDPAELTRKEPVVARDLAVRCSLCTDKTRCRHDLDRNPGNSAWQEYCMNTFTLTALIGRNDGKKGGPS
jgi:hypothetical protein